MDANHSQEYWSDDQLAKVISRDEILRCPESRKCSAYVEELLDRYYPRKVIMTSTERELTCMAVGTLVAIVREGGRSMALEVMGSDILEACFELRRRGYVDYLPTPY